MQPQSADTRIEASIRGLQEVRDDLDDTIQLEANVQAHPGVEWVDGLAAVRLTRLDPERQATAEQIYSQLKQLFRDAVGGLQPWHESTRTWPQRIQGLDDEAAIRSVEWIRSRKISSARTAQVVVASSEVAELLYSARNQDVLCHADVQHIKRTPKSVQRWGLEQEQDPVQVKCLEVIDVDPTEREERRNKKGRFGEDCQYHSRTLWGVDVDNAHIDFLKRSLVINCSTTGTDDYHRKASVDRISFQISSIQHVKCMADSSGRFLGLRTRRPPRLLTAIDGVGEGEQLAATVDPSHCEAFGSPTVYYCLRFVEEDDYNYMRNMLQSFKLKVHKQLWVLLPPARQDSRHRSTPISHHLPSIHPETKFLWPLTLEDISQAGDSEFRVQYFLECLLHHGHLRTADVSKLLQNLRTLRRWGVIEKYSDALRELVGELPPVHRCNDGTTALSKVQQQVDKRAVLQREASRAVPQHAAQALPSSLGASTFHTDNSYLQVRSQSTSATTLATSQASLSHPSTSYSGLPPYTNNTREKNGGVEAWTHFQPAAGENNSEKQLNDKEEQRRTRVNQNGQVWLRKLVITPLRLLPYPETPEESNRILRRYEQFSDRFLRVSFANEALSSLSHFELSEEVETRLKEIMRKGLRVCNRRFFFLGYSNSQLKQHSCWMYCEENRDVDGAPSADEIRKAAGNLNVIRVPSKYAARFAQCFSTTFATLTLKPEQLCDLPDFIAESGEEFSDGIGVITSEGMHMVVQMLPVQQQQALQGEDVAAIQVRIGGCKGVLARWDNIPGMKEGAVVGLRPSMKKFESTALELEVCAVARVMPCIINRQVIMALLSLGVQPEVLWDLYLDHVKDLDHLLTGSEAAISVLRAMGCVDPAHSTDLHVASGSLAACMIAAGMHPASEPLLLSLMHAYRAFALKGIVDKCRVLVKQGILLLGTMDESGDLPEGTFWASWDRPTDSHQDPHATSTPQPLPVGTPAVVSRHPVLSPSDLRILHAADPKLLPKELTSRKNVVVFPKKGMRPEQCKMSGGDLDGDTFFIIWDPKLIPKEQAEARDYRNSQVPEEVPRGVTVTDMIEFFLRFIRNDQLGRICNLHLAMADASPFHANDRNCEELALLHSIAVDFGKTGISVDHTRVNDVAGNVTFPDYMNGFRRSDTVIGRIYRDALKRNEQGVEGGVQRREGAHKCVGEAPHVAEGWLKENVPGSAELAEWAEEMLGDWTVDFCDMMSSYCLVDVGQVVTGRVLSFNGSAVGREKNADHQARLNRHLSHLVHRYHTSCFPDMHTGDYNSLSNTDTTIWRPGAQARRNDVARMLAQRAGGKASEDDGSFEEVVCKVAALYAAANARQTPSGRMIDMHEQLVRMALPWHMAPRQLAALISCIKSNELSNDVTVNASDTVQGSTAQVGAANATKA